MKSIIIFSFFLFLAGAARSQTLVTNLEGKWKMTRYSSTIKSGEGVTTGAVEFKPDGKFISEGFFFGTQTGSFRTDETRNVVLIETETGITEWQVYLKKNVLRLLATPKEDKGKVFLIFSKVE